MEETKLAFKRNNPDDFPVYNLSYKFKAESDYQSIFDILNDFNQNFEDLAGFNCYIRKSRIRHLEAQDGVFVNSKKKKILPGTLLGFYPGVIYSRNKEKPKNEYCNYLRRPNGCWVDPSANVPYPKMNLAYLAEYDSNIEKRLSTVKLPLYKTCHLGIGHKINHPPPDSEANVKFFDFKVPPSFYPSSFSRYIPNIMYERPKSKNISDFAKILQTLEYRLIGVVSIKDILNDDELYADYR